jgi:DNA-binding response OmpR family regulator
MTARPSIPVLYVEDDYGLARLFQRRMARYGFDVATAHDGRVGLEMWDSGMYEILAVDHDLPYMTGLEIIRTLASRGSVPPIVMVTAARDDTVAHEALRLGAYECIIKDLRGDYLERIPQALRQARRNKSPDFSQEIPEAAVKS